MEVFTEHKIEWLIGVACAFLPAVLGEIIKRTSKIPDITIPFWLFCLMIGLIPAYFAITTYSNKTKDIANKSFGVERVIVDGKHFANCKFDGTELVITGKRPFGFSSNTFKNIRFKVEGNAAMTIHALTAMYGDEGFRPFVDGTFENIKKEGLNRSTNKKP